MNKIPSDLRVAIDACEVEFIKLILKRLGIIVRHNNTDLVNSIMEACHKFQCDPNEYLNMLSNCSDSSPLLEHLVAVVTVGETYFFRDKYQVKILKDTLLPRIIRAKREENSLTLRVWSAACASGEEIYTISMLLREMLTDIHRWTVHLLGTDINTVALKKAKEGLYNKWSMRSIPEYYKQQYFLNQNNQYLLNPAICDMVNFRYLNLNDNTYPSILNGTHSQDLIICRNLLIYFSSGNITRLMKKFSASLVDGGALMLGASDPVNIEGTDLVSQFNEGMVFLRRNSVNNITQSSAVSQKTKSPDKTPTAKSATLPYVSKHLDKACLQELSITRKTDEPPKITSAMLLTLEAKTSANLGHLDEALKYCEESLLLDSTNKDTYFTYGLTLTELDRNNEAEVAFRKALFLDYQYVEVHFQLGILLLKNRLIDSGLKSLRNALAIVEASDSSRLVEGFNWLNYARFAEIIKAEIELYIMAGSANNEKEKPK